MENSTIKTHEANAPVPTYALYGESEQHQALELMHCESIAARSARYGWHIAPHQHDVLFQVLYVSAGGGHAELEDRCVKLEAGSLVINPPLCVHGFDFRRDVHGWVVSIPDASVRKLADTLPLPLDGPRHVHLPERADTRAEMDGLLRRIAAEYHHPRRGRAASLEALTTLLLVSLVRLAGPVEEAPPGARQTSHVQRFRGLIENTFREPWSVKGYARHLGISATQLNRLCRNATGRSALALVHERILLEAKRELIYTALGIAEIAYALGFRDPAYFARFFASRTGLSPTRFRAERQQGMAAQPGRAGSHG